MPDSRTEASIAFGKTIHWAAVHLGSKTLLGERAGVDKSVVQTVTRGQAHNLDRDTLLRLVIAVHTVVHPVVLEHIKGLVNHIKPTLSVV